MSDEEKKWKAEDEMSKSLERELTPDLERFVRNRVMGLLDMEFRNKTYSFIEHHSYAWLRTKRFGDVLLPESLFRSGESQKGENDED